jgi:3-dehydroquinate dehydratase
VLGMGVPARETRTEFALKGSCLTYGYLDSPVAPGQPPSAALVEELSRLLPAYREDVAARRAVRIQRATRDHS